MTRPSSLGVGAQVKLAVLGPQAAGQGLFSDYFGDDICYGLTDHYQNNLHCVPTIAAGLRALNTGGHTTNQTGVRLFLLLSLLSLLANWVAS